MVIKSAEELIEGEVLDTDSGPIVIKELDFDDESVFIYGSRDFYKEARRNATFGVFDENGIEEV